MKISRSPKLARSAVGLLSVICLSNSAFAATAILPTGGSVVAGSAAITQTANEVDINQSTSRAIINWSSFNIGAGSSVVFNQPSSTSVTLNRVVNSTSASQISGNLTANGNVMLVNSQGVIFNNTSAVNVGGLLVSASDISNTNFMAGTYKFDQPGSPNAWIINAGTITVKDSGLAAFVAPNVVNEGLISAKLGKVQLASGDTFSVDLYGDGLINLQASDQLKAQLVQNSGTIKANGGEVLMTTAAARDAVDSLINMDGIVEANTVGQIKGQVVLYAAATDASSTSSAIEVSGKIHAKGKKAGEVGGSITLNGSNVDVITGAKISASGAAGGGSVQVGRQSQTGQALTQTVVEPGTSIKANALSLGNGGSVLIEADNLSYSGTTSANGLGLDGAGGMVAMMAKDNLFLNGSVTASATAGAAGTWLVQAGNVTIQDLSSSPSYVGVVSFDPALLSGGSLVDNNSVSAALSSGTSVTINATNTDGQSGNITVANSVAKTAGNDDALSLNASSNAVMDPNTSLLSSMNKLDVNVIANRTTGAILMGSGSTIQSNGGNVAFDGGAVVLNASASVLSTGGNINFGSQIVDQGSALFNNGILLNDATVDAQGGNITMTGLGYTTGKGIVVEKGTQIGGADDTGSINFVADTVAMTNDSAIKTSGLVTFDTYNPGTSIGIAGASGVLQLNNIVLDDITAGTVQIGDTTTHSGLVTTNAYNWRSNALFLNGTNDIAINGTVTMDSHSFLADTASGNMLLGTDGGVTSSASGNAIVLAASFGNFISQNENANALSASSADGRWLIYSSSPSLDTMGGLASDFHRYSCIYGGSCPSFAATGNGDLYRITPVFTVTADAAVTTVGEAAPSFTYTLSGALLPGDAASVTGAPTLTTPYVIGNSAGNYDINVSAGTMASGIGYSFAYATLTNGLTVNPDTVAATSTTTSLLEFNQLFQREIIPGFGRRPNGTLLSILNPPTQGAGGLGNLSPSSGGRSASDLANLSPSAGGAGPVDLANLSPAAGGRGTPGSSVTTLIECNEATPCDINE